MEFKSKVEKGLNFTNIIKLIAILLQREPGTAVFKIFGIIWHCTISSSILAAVGGSAQGLSMLVAKTGIFAV